MQHVQNTMWTLTLCCYTRQMKLHAMQCIMMGSYHHCLPKTWPKYSHKDSQSIGVISQKDTKQIEQHQPKVKMDCRNLALQWPVRPWCHVWQSFRAQLGPALIKEFPWEGRKENDCQTDSSQKPATLNSESSSIWFTSNPQDRSDFAADTFAPNPSVADLLWVVSKCFESKKMQNLVKSFTRQDSASHQRKVHNRPESAEEMQCFSPLLKGAMGFCFPKSRHWHSLRPKGDLEPLKRFK